MRVAFLDESISDGHYFIGALSGTAAVSLEITQTIDNYLVEATQNINTAIDPDWEIHGKALWRGVEVWTSIKEVDRHEIFKGLVREICQLNFQLLFIGINKENMANRYRTPEPPHELALKFLLEAMDREFEHQNVHGLVICDEIGTKAEQNKYRGKLREYRNIGTAGFSPRYLHQIADTLHFVPSDQSRSIQAIDLFTYMHRRRIVNSRSGPAEVAMMADMWRNVLPHIALNRIWP